LILTCPALIWLIALMPRRRARRVTNNESKTHYPRRRMVIFECTVTVILSGKFFGDKDTMELGEGTDNTAQISYEHSPYGGGAPVMKVVMR